MLNIFVLIFITLLALTALYDLRYRRIPNILNASMILIAFIYQIILFGFSGILYGISGLFIGLGLLFIPFALRGMGAGDVKMLGAVGAFLGPKGVVVSFLYTAILGGIWAVLVLLLRHRPVLLQWATDVKAMLLTRSLAFLPRQSRKSPRFAYGAVIALGAILYILLDVYGVQLVSL